MVDAIYILSKDGDRECLEALAYLSDHAPKYPNGTYVPPLRFTSKIEEPPDLIGVHMRLSRVSQVNGRKYVSRVEWYGETAEGTTDGAPEAIAAGVGSRLLTSANASHMLIVRDSGRGVLDVFLDTIGPHLMPLGYKLQPYSSSGKINSITIRKGKRSWKVVGQESLTGLTGSDGQAFAEHAAGGSLSGAPRAYVTYRVGAAVSAWLHGTFGVAMRPTVAMTAVSCARRFMPKEDWKWRPVPMMVAMEREARGYRGGLQFARRFKGRSWRIDVNRQYTHALRSELPMSSSFGRYVSREATPHGIFMCRVHLSDRMPYPLGVWCGNGQGFAYRICGRGEYVSALHTSEFAAIESNGGRVEPSYGFIYTRTFSLAGYVERLQGILSVEGRHSPIGRLTKALGNYLYGKFGQRPDQLELMFSTEKPGETWHPYADESGRDWEGVWERQTVRYTSSQHVDIAGTLTGAARSQTGQMWALLSAFGATVVRCHTDSLTVDVDPREIVSTNSHVIGGWKLEHEDMPTVIAAPNAYSDDGVPHLAGVVAPTTEMIDRLYDGLDVEVTQEVNAPRTGWAQGAKEISRTYRIKSG